MYICPKENKVPAYTLLEIVTTLFIVGLIIYFSYSIMIFLNSQMENYKRENLEMSEVTLFSTSFSRDIYYSSNVVVSPSSVEFRNYDDSQIFYRISDGKIIKMGHKKNIEYQIEVLDFGYEREENINRVVHFFEFSTLMENDTIKLKFSKEDLISKF